VARGRERRHASLEAHLVHPRLDDFALPAVVVMLLIWLIVTATSNGVNLATAWTG
jgi:hypothetical protein